MTLKVSNISGLNHWLAAFLRLALKSFFFERLSFLRFDLWLEPHFDSQWRDCWKCLFRCVWWGSFREWLRLLFLRNESYFEATLEALLLLFHAKHCCIFFTNYHWAECALFFSAISTKHLQTEMIEVPFGQFSKLKSCQNCSLKAPKVTACRKLTVWIKKKKTVREKIWV